MEKDRTPLVSIIIPMYNDEEFVVKCLESVKFQTANFWEAWIIDDCSTDSSVKIAENFCADDLRFHILKNEKNSSAWICRAKGILASSESVKYIMFADADDSLALNAVERVVELMERDPVDILHFGTNCDNCGKKYLEYLQPPIKKLYGREVFDSFVERSFEGHLWNKMFDAQLLRDTINHVGAELYLPKAQDKVLYWAVCWQRNDLTYRGVGDKLYNYNFGQGVEGGKDELTLEQYRQYLYQANAENVITDIMNEHPEDIGEYSGIMEKSRYNLARHSARNWFRVCGNEKKSALEETAKFWNRPLDSARLVCGLAEFSWNNNMELSQLAGETGLFKTTKKPGDIKVIGTYYHRMDNGGIQRVIAELVKYWHESGYEIVVFTDNDPQPEDYELPEYVTRVRIDRPASKCAAGNYFERGMSFARLIQEYNVDCMVYHSYFSDVLLYDTLICKSMNVPFVLYYHNVFSRYLRYNDPKFSSIPEYSKLADALVCLDKTSAEWWKCFNGNVHTVLNPLTFDLESTPVAERNNHNILFLGRLVEEAKHPLDSIDIIAKVVEKIPDAKLYIVGTGEKKYLEKLNNRIAEFNMQGSVIMCGFDNDVTKYYLKSSVFLCCSSHEGFPMTLVECMSFGLPLVMYDLPYLTIAENNDGIISVPQRDTEAAAEEICRLLEERDTLISTGNAGRAYLEEMYKTDIDAQWDNIFNSINNFTPDYGSKENIMLANVIVNDYSDGAKASTKNNERLKFVEEKLEWNRKELKKNEHKVNVKFSDVPVLRDTIKVEFASCKNEIKKMNSELMKSYAESKRYLEEIYSIRASFSYKLGRFITWLPRMIRGLFKK